MKRMFLILICVAALLCLMACSNGAENGDATTSVAEAEIPGLTTFPLVSSQGLEYRINSDVFTCTVTGIGDCPDAYVAIGEHIDGYRVTAIADSAFYGNTQIKGFSVGKYVTTIGDYAFFGCSNMEVLVFNDVLTHVGQYAFADCGKVDAITIPETLSYVGAWAFYGCSGLTSVTITDLERWCAIAFDGVYANPVQEGADLYLEDALLTKLVLPESITRVGDWTFAGCKSLTEVVLHEAVTEIGQRAFLSCQALTKIHYPGTIEMWKALSMGSYWDSFVEEYVIICQDGEIKG